MKTLLINVTYTDNTDKFWFDSYIKNQKVKFDPETENIHKVIAELCSDEGMQLVYKGRPRGNVFVDTVNAAGEITGSRAIGYMYRGQTEIHDRDMIRPTVGRFDVWVTIREVTYFDIENVNGY